MPTPSLTSGTHLVGHGILLVVVDLLHGGPVDLLNVVSGGHVGGDGVQVGGRAKSSRRACLLLKRLIERVVSSKRRGSRMGCWSDRSRASENKQAVETPRRGFACPDRTERDRSQRPSH